MNRKELNKTLKELTTLYDECIQGTNLRPGKYGTLCHLRWNKFHELGKDILNEIKQHLESIR